MSFIEQVKVTGNIGGILDAVSGAAKPANVLQVGGNDGTNAFPIPLASGGGSAIISGSVTQGTAASSTGPWYTRPGAPTTSAWSQAAISFSSSGDNVIVAAVAAETIRIMRIFFVNSDATTSTNITIKDSTPTNFSGAFLMQSGASFNGFPTGDPIFITASGKAFEINSSAAVQISGTVWYTQS